MSCRRRRFNCYSLTTDFMVVDGDLFQDFGVWSLDGPTRSCGHYGHWSLFTCCVVDGPNFYFSSCSLSLPPPYFVSSVHIVHCCLYLCISVTLGGLTCCCSPLLNSIRFGVSLKSHLPRDHRTIGQWPFTDSVTNE